jgi:thiamine biosynthesis lipoprotein
LIIRCRAVAETARNSPAGPLVVEERTRNLYAACFSAMASPCEVLVHTSNRGHATELGDLVAHEAWRVEQKYSRYRDDSVLAWIHRNRGKEISVDAETTSLLDFAAHCYELSDARFDITSGVLRRAWQFDGSDRVPDQAMVERLLPLIGFDKLRWQSPKLLLPLDMELDFGGIGKEYAVDRAYDLAVAHRSDPFLINFGGDLRTNRPPPATAWQVGIERPGAEREAALVLTLERGALATSGDSRRFLLKDSIRYGHILDPRSGWPVPNAPRSVTVAASSCTEAGLLATLAMLQGAQARSFLEAQQVQHWILE